MLCQLSYQGLVTSRPRERNSTSCRSPPPNGLKSDSVGPWLRGESLVHEVVDTVERTHLRVPARWVRSQETDVLSSANQLVVSPLIWEESRRSSPGQNIAVASRTRSHRG